MRKLSLLLVVFAAATFAHAGGPAYVAGASYFDPAVKGTPLTWANGAVTYYTDQGNLSALLPGPSADAGKSFTNVAPARQAASISVGL